MRQLGILLGIALFAIAPAPAAAQKLDRALLTHSSESISIAPLLSGMVKRWYKKEGVDLHFRILRGDLTVAAMINSREVDYIYGAGTAFLAAVRGAPVKILSHDFKSVLFYFIVQPGIQSAKDLKGKKVAISSIGGTGTASTRGLLRARGRDPDQDTAHL